MSYDQEVQRYISKHTRLTGVEAKNLYRTMEKKGIDYQTIDFETVGQNMYGHGHRTKGAKDVIMRMSGINLHEQQDEFRQYQEIEVHRRQGNRSPRSLHRDNMINARHTFKITNNKGVSRWLKHPNRYDIKDIDDLIKF